MREEHTKQLMFVDINVLALLFLCCGGIHTGLVSVSLVLSFYVCVFLP